MKLENSRPGLKHVAIADLVRRQIAEGVFRPGDRLPTFAELRTEYNASEDTIERAYANLESERIVVRRHRVGTFVSTGKPEPRRKKTTRHGTLGVIIPEALHNYSFYTRILSGIQSVTLRVDIDITLLGESARPHWEKVDGVLTVGAIEPQAIPPGMPVVSLFHVLPGVASVITDDKGGIRQLVEHLLGLGHRRIAYMSCYRLKSQNGLAVATNSFDERAAGFHEALAAAGIVAEESWVRPLLNVPEGKEFVAGAYVDERTLGRESMNKWLREGWGDLGCTALLAQNDLAAIGVIEALQDSGIRVPQDLSVVGFDGLEAGQFFCPRLTTVCVPLEEIAARGVSELIEKINLPVSTRAAKTSRKKIFKPIVFPATLKLGASSSHPR